MSEIMKVFETADVILLVVALNALGFVLKRIPCIPSNYIPAVLAVVGILGYQGIAGWGVKEALIGVVAAAAAIGGHRLVKDYLAEPDENKKPIPPEPGSVSQ
jgi:hypothetical protein